MPDPLEALLRIRCENDLVLRLQAIVEDQYRRDRKSRSVSAFARDALWERVLAEEKNRGIGPAGNALLNETGSTAGTGDRAIKPALVVAAGLAQKLARAKLHPKAPAHAAKPTGSKG